MIIQFDEIFHNLMNMASEIKLHAEYLLNERFSLN